ncbi:hypothetical protein XENOCAPTIV_017483 [Xenoophorus captivus]|uniref:Uncharacterized protein n=1 Tax=Xenoophorus captivus TaxID=1517983 RepID=A0ABV0QAF7_9TELE
MSSVVRGGVAGVKRITHIQRLQPPTQQVQVRLRARATFAARLPPPSTGISGLQHKVINLSFSSLSNEKCATGHNYGRFGRKMKLEAMELEVIIIINIMVHFLKTFENNIKRQS